jgi:limonene-1,2-epoxide hydrolase
MRLAAILVALLALTACGGHKTSSSSSAGEVARAWSAALDRNDSEAAGRLFADGAQVIQSDVETLATHADAVHWNSALPCGGRITLLEPQSGGRILVIFVLTERPHHICDAPGSKAAAVFQVKNGKIVVWHEVEVPALPSTQLA